MHHPEASIMWLTNPILIAGAHYQHPMPLRNSVDFRISRRRRKAAIYLTKNRLVIQYWATLAEG